MKLVTFEYEGNQALGVVADGAILNLKIAFSRFNLGPAPADMVALIAGWASLRSAIEDALAAAKSAKDAPLWQSLSGTTLLAPIPRPTKNVFCVGRNYKAHIEEGARARGREVKFPTVPEFFTKPPTAVVGPEAEIPLDPKVTTQMDYEVELAIVIGKRCRNLTTAEVEDVIFGYTIVNDVSARDLQLAHVQFFKGKGLDASCPIGPYIVTADEFGDPSGHRITLRVNGKTRQDSNTSDLLFGCTPIVESLSKGLTLEPGDIIATGTPAGVALGMTPQAWLRPGDIVEAEVEGLGILRNTIREV